MKTTKKQRTGKRLATALFGALTLIGCDNKKHDSQELLATEYNCGVVVGREHYVGDFYSQGPQDKTFIRESMRPKEHYFIPEQIPKTSVFGVNLDYDEKDDIQKVQTLVGRAMYNLRYIDLRNWPCT